MKTLIYFFEKYISPSGGPSGYLYNLKKRRDELSDNEIVFLNEKDFDPKLSYKVMHKMHCLGAPRKELSDHAAWIEEVLYQSGKKGPFDLSGYDVIHFHSIIDMYSQKKNLEGFKGKVLLTSHTPKMPYREYIEDTLDHDEYLKHKDLFDRVEEFAEYSFRNADYLVFPCKYAEEPYYHTWDAYPEIRDEKKILYLPTGVPKISVRRSREEIRKELNIPEDRFVISFVGRHISVKGYDRLVSLFGKLSNVTVLCCGREGAVKHPDSPDWIEIGWTDDPFSYVNASDLFFLPNRETYFDLSLLETMSFGKCSLISLTGGNKTFAGREDCGIYTFGTDEQALELVRSIMETEPEKIRAEEAAQVQLYEEEYTVARFYDRYKDMLRKIDHET